MIETNGFAGFGGLRWRFPALRKQSCREKKALAAAGAVDKAYLQKIWDGWATLDRGRG